MKNTKVILTVLVFGLLISANFMTKSGYAQSSICDLAYKEDKQVVSKAPPRIDEYSKRPEFWRPF